MPCATTSGSKKCDPKCRCKSGPCAGIAYSCENPCPGGSRFDPVTCSCGTDGTWLVTTTLSGQINPANNGTRCSVAYFPPAYFNSNGDSITREWFYSQQPWPNHPGPESAFVTVDPNGPQIGYPTTPGGPPGASILLGGGGMTSTCVLKADYCSNPGIDGAGHTNGIVSWRNVVNNAYVGTNNPVPGGAVNYASCDDSRTGIIKTSLQYLGPGEPTDYYEGNELGGDSSSKYRLILDGETGQPACFGPTKSP